MSTLTEKAPPPTTAAVDNAKRHCGDCRELGHSARTCRGALERSSNRLKEVLELHKAGLPEDRGRQSQQAAPRVREVYALKGPRYRGNGVEYYSEYRFR